MLLYFPISILISTGSNARNIFSESPDSNKTTLRARRLLTAYSFVNESIGLIFDTNIPYLGIPHFLQKRWFTGSLFFLAEIGAQNAHHYFNDRIVAKNIYLNPNVSNTSISYSEDAAGYSAKEYQYVSLTQLANQSVYYLRLIDIFTAYRRLHEKTTSINRVVMNTESVPGLFISPFKWRHLKKSWVFIPIAIAGAVAMFEPMDGRSISQAETITMLGHRYQPHEAALISSGIDVFRYSLVATAEEMLWRGIIQTELTESVNPTFACICSSLLFALWHVPSHGWRHGISTGLAGGYLGYRYMKNGYDLGETITIHFWLNWLPNFIRFLRQPVEGPFVFSIDWQF